MTTEELELAVQHHNRLYWVDDAALIPDPLFDQLVERLRSLAPTSPILEAIGPAGAGEELGYGDKVEHEASMLSLDKAYDEETVLKWFDSFEGVAVGSPKIDGIACSLRYGSDGAIRLAATRGDGTRGEVITENVKRIADIPARLDAKDLEVRGEVYMRLSIFKTYEGKYANPRNLAAGALKQKDPAKTGDYRLSFFAYDVLGTELSTELEKFEYLASLGFTPVPTRRLERDQLQTHYQSVVATRFDQDFEMDGVVFRTNQVSEQVRLGVTAHHPRFAIAYKFQGESGASRLVDVLWSVSRTGAINPVAIVEPVFLSGATVTKASLHNLALIEGLGLKHHSTLLMSRRGGVIPHVESVLEAGEGDIVYPELCPSCGNGPTVRRNDVLFCPDQTRCLQAQLGLLKHFVDAIDCKGFGPKLIEQLFDDGIVRSPAEFYALQPDTLLHLERMGETLAQKLVGNIEARRELGLADFLRSLSINDLGKVASKVVASHFGSLRAVREASAESIAQIYGLGELTGVSIREGLLERAEVIDRLLEYVTVLDATAEAETSSADGAGPLTGKQFLFTGTLTSMKRKDAQDQVQALGGQTPDNIVKELDYLVIGDEDFAKFQGGWRSSKLKKAESFNAQGARIAIIGETEFLTILKSGTRA